MINSNKDNVINHFIEGSKNEFFLGVENEKCVFDKDTNKRSNFLQITQVLNFLHKNFGWQKIKENENLIGLFQNNKQVTLEPGNQIELAGSKLKNIHEVCSESYVFQDQLLKACKKFNLKLLSIGFDLQTQLRDVP